MKLEYKKQERKRILHPIDLMVEEGTTYETTDKDLQKRLKAEGFTQVKEEKKKEDDE